MTADPEERVYDDKATLATAIATRLLERLSSLQSRGRVPSVALTGGSIARDTYAEVARLTRLDGAPRVDWARVDLWWGDDRYVPAASDDRNHLVARAVLLDLVGLDPDRVHEMPPSDGPYDDVHAAAAAYGDEVRRDGGGGFDLVLLGVGPDGHVASLFPGHPELTSDEVAVGVVDSPKPPPERVSLTFGALNRTDAVWFLVAGGEKAEACGRGRRDSVGLDGVGSDTVRDTPATGVRGRDETLWLIDRAAAGQA